MWLVEEEDHLWRRRLQQLQHWLTTWPAHPTLLVVTWIGGRQAWQHRHLALTLTGGMQGEAAGQVVAARQILCKIHHSYNYPVVIHIDIALLHYLLLSASLLWLFQKKWEGCHRL